MNRPDVMSGRLIMAILSVEMRSLSDVVLRESKGAGGGLGSALIWLLNGGFDMLCLSGETHQGHGSTSSPLCTL